MIAAVLMGVGAAVWLAGELAAVLSGRRLGEPTTFYVRLFERRYLPVRILVGVFVVWLFAHFEFNAP